MEDKKMRSDGVVGKRFDLRVCDPARTVTAIENRSPI
jgi:hypothetical protein